MSDKAFPKTKNSPDFTREILDPVKSLALISVFGWMLLAVFGGNFWVFLTVNSFLIYKTKKASDQALFALGLTFVWLVMSSLGLVFYGGERL